MPFTKGQSGNPSGRPKKTEAQILFEHRCREYLTSRGWKRLEKMADSDDKFDIRYALDKILNHGIGRPKESVDVTSFEGEDTRPDSEIMEEAKHLYERLGKAKSESNGAGPEKKG